MLENEPMSTTPEHTLEMREAFSARVNELMTAKGWYSARLAREVGKSQVTVDRWLSGTIPELNNLVILSKALDTTADYLLYGSRSDDACFMWAREIDDDLHRKRLRQALYVLKSNTEYASSLEMNINSFYKSVTNDIEQRHEIDELKKQVAELLANNIPRNKSAASTPPRSKPESNRDT